MCYFSFYSEVYISDSKDAIDISNHPEMGKFLAYSLSIPFKNKKLIKCNLKNHITYNI